MPKSKADRVRGRLAIGRLEGGLLYIDFKLGIPVRADAIDALDRALIEAALDRAGTVQGAAELLDMNRSWLFRRSRELGIPGRRPGRPRKHAP